MVVTYYLEQDCGGSYSVMDIDGPIDCLEDYKSFKITGNKQCNNW